MHRPPDVILYATQVAEALQAQVERRKQASKAVIVGKKRKLILGLKEELSHVCGGVMEGIVLQSWLQQLQREFEVRMLAIEQEANQVDLESLALDEEMEDLESVLTNDNGSVVHRDGDEILSSRGAESMIEDDSNMTDRY
jgi:DNA mismatch repair protein MSH4